MPKTLKHDALLPAAPENNIREPLRYRVEKRALVQEEPHIFTYFLEDNIDYHVAKELNASALIRQSQVTSSDLRKSP